MIEVRIRRLLSASVDEVWTFITSADTASNWMKGVLDAGLLTEGTVGVGKRFRKVQRFVRLTTRMDYEIVEYEPGRKIAYRTDYGPLSYRGAITLEPAAGGTSLDYLGTGNLRGALKPLEPLAARVAKKRFENDFSTLNRLLSARARQPR